MDRFIEAGLIADRGRGEHADRTGEDSSFIREDVAEEISRDDDVEEGRMDGELLRAVVDIHMVELNIRIVLVMDLDDGASPEAGGRKDIGFVDTCQVTMTLAGRFHGETGDAVDFRHRVVFQIPGSFCAVMDLGFTAVAEVNAANELTDDHDVGAFGNFRFQRRILDHGVLDLHGTEVYIKAKRFSQAENGFFRTERRLQVIPLIAADSAEEDGVCLLAGINGILRQRFTEFVVGCAACIFPFIGKADLVNVIDLLQDFDSRIGDLCTDAVTRDDNDVFGHDLILLIPYISSVVM